MMTKLIYMPYDHMIFYAEWAELKAFFKVVNFQIIQLAVSGQKL